MWNIAFTQHFAHYYYYFSYFSHLITDLNLNGHFDLFFICSCLVLNRKWKFSLVKHLHPISVQPQSASSGGLHGHGHVSDLSRWLASVGRLRSFLNMYWIGTRSAIYYWWSRAFRNWKHSRNRWCHSRATSPSSSYLPQFSYVDLEWRLFDQH